VEEKKLKNIQKRVKGFDYSLDYNNIDFRKHPELYQIGKGEQGVLLVQPYKNELLPFWRFKTPEIAQKSAEKIYKLFLKYKKEKDFVGMDMARKFLQMGYTRSRRYANHKSGKKYDGPVPIEHRGESGSHGRKILSLDHDECKAICATFFYEKWHLTKNDLAYQKLKEKHFDLIKNLNKSS
jgi:hypothetical protein